ncbi:MAG TPA: DnaJ C-terminal domain-containing protein [Rhodanobacteraceae bacterium]|nr:DnaJ C-terminal domain-containing protein [Rhodanobacteraceae bacterium]
MEFKDYYETLGVKPDANEAQIKAAYRKLARKYHPDVSKEPGAEEKIKAVNEAHEVLRDKEKRAAYDNLRAGGYRGGDQFRPPPDWAQQQHGGFEFRGSDTGGFGEGDVGGFSDFFESLFGRGAARGPRGPMRGRDVRAGVEIDLRTAYSGGKQRLGLRDAHGDRTLEVNIPAGILPGRVIRLAGQGERGAQGGPAGDLLLEVQVRDDPRFRLEGHDVLVEIAVAPWEAALGAKVPVPTLGGEVELSIPANSRSGRKLRLKGRGMPRSGDQIVTLVIQTPPADDEKSREAYAAFEQAFKGFDPRM